MRELVIRMKDHIFCIKSLFFNSLYIFICVFFFVSKNPYLQAQQDICEQTNYYNCVAEEQSWSNLTNIDPNLIIQKQKCVETLGNAYKACSGAAVRAQALAITSVNGAFGVTSSNIATKAPSTTTTTTAGAAEQSGTFSDCANFANQAATSCNPTGMKHCMFYQSQLSQSCTKFAASAGETAARAEQITNAAKSLESAKSDYSWVKPALIGAAVGAGAMALMGGKKSGNSGGTPAPATKPDDKLAPINLNGSTASAAPTPSVVYYPPSNNNGSLGNPAVIGSTTSTSTPADTIKVAGITPSTSFASGQGSSINTDSSSNRTLSSSGAATPASASSVGSGSTDSGGGVGGGGSDSASLVDPSGKSAGGGGSFSGMDGGSGSGSSTQAASADGTMLTGIPGGKSDPQSTKLKALASKKAQVAQTQPSTTNTKPLVRRRLATPPVKVSPPVNLKQDMRSRGLIK